MGTDRDTRDAILLLVNACNDYQIRCLVLTSAFRALQLRVDPCECDVQAETLKAYNDAEAIVEAQTKEVKAALEGSAPFLEALTKFATRHYLDFEHLLPRTQFH